MNSWKTAFTDFPGTPMPSAHCPSARLPGWGTLPSARKCYPNLGRARAGFTGTRAVIPKALKMICSYANLMFSYSIIRIGAVKCTAQERAGAPCSSHLRPASPFPLPFVPGFDPHAWQCARWEEKRRDPHRHSRCKVTRTAEPCRVSFSEPTVTIGFICISVLRNYGIPRAISRI